METIANTRQTANDPGYDALELMVVRRLSGTVGPLFTTDVDPGELWSTYLTAIPEAHRQHYNCSACRHFVKDFGGLVTVGPDGNTTPVAWEDPGDQPDGSALGFFSRVIHKLYKRVARARITGVFLSKAAALGKSESPAEGDKQGRVWTHLHGANPCPFSHKLLTANQAAAEKKEEFGMLQRALADYSPPQIAQALGVLKSGALCRSEKATQVLEWLLGVHDALEPVAGRDRKNAVVWRAVALAPVGFCHVRNTVAGTLLDDIAAGMEFDTVKDRWEKKLHPLQYQRPRAAPTEGQIAAAEKLVADLGIAAALKRRYATLEDVQVRLWTPARTGVKPAEEGGVFSHLKPRKWEAEIVVGAQNITWVKFRDTVLGGALDMEVLVPARSGGFYGLLTAEDPGAPAIIQWDGLEGRERNPVSWYFYNGGSAAVQWGLTAEYTPVTAVFPAPFQWQEPTKFTHQGEKVFFALKGARDTRKPSLCLFPEILKNELRAARSTIEAHSASGTPSGAELGTANGIGFGRDGKFPVTVRVRAAFGAVVYIIDRWD